MSDTPRTSKGSVRHALGLDRGDRAAAWLIVALLAAAIVGSAVFAVTRIVTIAQGVDVPVTWISLPSALTFRSQVTEQQSQPTSTASKSPSLNSPAVLKRR